MSTDAISKLIGNLTSSPDGRSGIPGPAGLMDILGKVAQQSEAMKQASQEGAAMQMQAILTLASAIDRLAIALEHYTSSRPQRQA